MYDAQITLSDLLRSIEKHFGRIGYIQVADPPERHEPGSGELNLPFLFDLLERLDRAGSVGRECRPLAGAEAGLGWLRPYLG